MRGRSTVRRRAFEGFFVAEMPGLYRAARRRVHNDADAEDLVQETMLRAYRAFDEARPPDNPAAWCQTILSNLITDRARARQRTPDTMSVDDSGAGLYDRLEAGRETGMFSDPHRLIERWSNRDEVRAALATLPEWGREVLVLAHGNGDDGLALTARLPPEPGLPGAGDVVEFAFADRHVHRFDAASGERLP